MYKFIYVLSGFIIYMTLSTIALGQEKTTQKLYPWKSSSGRIGFCDEYHRIKIQPQFEDASLFKNEFAVITENGKQGVIDESNLRIIDCIYDQIDLIAIGVQTAAVTKKSNNAWWKISKWRLFPGFSVMGGNGDKRWFDTDVPTTQWKVMSLPDKHTIANSIQVVKSYLYASPRIRTVGETKILINNDLFDVQNKKMRHVAKNVVAVLSDTALIQQRGNSFYILDQHFKPKKSQVFQLIPQVLLQADGQLRQLQSERIDHGIPVKLDLMQDQKSNIYIFPDVYKVFPQHIADYPNAHTTTSAILQHAVMVHSIPQSPYFIIGSNDDNHNIAFYILHQDGSWESDKTNVGDFRLTSNAGNLLFPSPAEMGICNSLPGTFVIERVEGISTHPSWFVVRGRYQNKRTNQSGIFDVKTLEWIVPLTYFSLDPLANYPNIWRFQTEEEADYKARKFGLIDLESGNVILHPKYNSISAYGKAGIYEGDKWEYFYIDPINGTAFKE